MALYVNYVLDPHAARTRIQPARAPCDLTFVINYGVISVSKTDIPDASVRNFMQAFVTSCKRFKNFMQAVQNFMQAVPKLYASGPKLYASVRNFMQAV